VRALLLVLAAAAALLGGAGGATHALERRLQALAPGGVEIDALHYNPFNGRLALTGVRARDASGRDLFRTAAVEASVSPLPLLAGSLTLARVRVSAPRLTLAAASVRSGLPILGAGPPLHVADLAVVDGRVEVEGAGEGGAPLRVHDLDLRLGRLTTAANDQPDVVFAVEMAMYGTTVRVTGQPRGAGYVLHVRARGLDVAALTRDFPIPGLELLRAGPGEVDGDVVLTGGRLLASGHARVGDVALALPVSGRPRLRAAAVTVVADGFDLASGTGRIARIEMATPTLSLPVGTAATTLAALAELLRSPADVRLRRVSITDGTLVLTGAGGARLERVQLSAHAPERRADGAWTVSARAGLGRGAGIALDGSLTRDLRELDATARLHGVAVAPWRVLTGATADWDARVSFQGRLRAAAREGEPALLVSGDAVLAEVSGPGRDGFRAERIALGIRQLRWPAAAVVVDTVVMTRPAFVLPVATPWPGLLVTGSLSVVGGELRGAPSAHPLGDLEVRVPADSVGGAAGVPLRLLVSALDDAMRAAGPPPSASPATP
jgi:hypothetical protein